jgi:hypothetical protein
VLFLVHRFLSPWWRRRQVLPKRRFLQEPHGVTTQKTPFFTANVVPSSPILVTLMVVALCSSDTSVLTRATWRTIQEDGILQGRHWPHLKKFNLTTLRGTKPLRSWKLLSWSKLPMAYGTRRFFQYFRWKEPERRTRLGRNIASRHSPDGRFWNTNVSMMLCLI